MKCNTCSRPAKPGRLSCAQCMKKAVGYNKETRLRRFRAGMCYWCGKHRHQPGVRACRWCRVREWNKRQQLRRAAIAHYGGKCACPGCHEDRIEFLQMDHIDGGGAQHRKALFTQGISLFQWLKNKGYPAGFRVLCANCNLSRGFYGYCPHEGCPAGWAPPCRKDTVRALATALAALPPPDPQALAAYRKALPPPDPFTGQS